MAMPIVPHEIEWTAEKSKRLWDYYGGNPKMARLFFGHVNGPFVAERLFEKVRLARDAHILDFSCGNGDVVSACLELMRHAQEIYATDVSEIFVERVTKRFAQQPRFKGAILMESLRTSLPDRTFDVVIATEVIEHLFDHELDGLLAECKRLLKPAGGQVFLTTPNNEDYEAEKVFCPDCGCVFHRWQHVRTWTADTLRAYMEMAGFQTHFAEPVAWASRRLRIWSVIRRIPLPKTGLLYIGEPRT
jgi:2-polyprenyl-3-methyl-5-hydroxy-6-metoxy-1,4-benzoquinol methylase